MTPRQVVQERVAAHIRSRGRSVVALYNTVRPHSSLGGMAPAEPPPPPPARTCGYRN